MALNGWDKWDKPPGRSYPTYMHPYKAKKQIFFFFNFALPVITLWSGVRRCSVRPPVGGLERTRSDIDTDKFFQGASICPAIGQ